MNKRRIKRNKERNKYAKLTNLVKTSAKYADPIDIPNCSGSLVNDEFFMYGDSDESKVEKLAFYKKQRIERGFDDTELWNLFYTLSKYMLPRLIEFRKVMNGFPPKNNICGGEKLPENEDIYGFECFEDWQEAVDKMIYSFDHIVNEDKYKDERDAKFHIDWDGIFKEKKLPNGNYGLEHTEKYDKKVMDAYYKDATEENSKIDEGLRLFGIYFQNLWW